MRLYADYTPLKQHKETVPCCIYCGRETGEGCYIEGEFICEYCLDINSELEQGG